MECPKVYIGEIGRALDKRINEQHDVRYAREPNARFIHLRDEGQKLTSNDVDQFI